MKAIRLAKRWFLASFALIWVIWAPNAASARDLWTTLAEFESGGNDRAVGAAGEISRYQIRPELWKRYAPVQANWRHWPDALAVARKIMADRSARFEQTFHRAPTSREFYILWNAPAQVRRPHRVVAQRADRFCGLLAADHTQYLASNP